ncbi:MAG: hypothetical protein ABIP38_00395 [Steroidobacteraceae bacterium]
MNCRMLMANCVAMGLATIATATHAAEHPAVAREMAGVWLPDSRRSGRPPQEWPLRPEALAARDRYRAQHGPIDPTVDDANASCIPEPMPYPVRLFAQYPFEILFTPARMTMFFEIYGNVRRIPIGAARGASLEALPTPMGHSRGHWENDTLVVETAQLRREGAGQPRGDPPVSNARRIVERWSMGKDESGQKQLRNDISIIDPVVLTQPVSFRMVYKWSPDIEVGEYLCQQDIWDQNLQGSPSTVPWRQ